MIFKSLVDHTKYCLVRYFRLIETYLAISSLENALKIASDDTYAHERVAGAISKSKKQLEESEEIISSVKKVVAEINLSLDDVDESSKQ